MTNNPATTNATRSSRQARIPFTLQAVFLASNRGKDVHKPPPEKVASKVFFSNWFLQRRPVSRSSNKQATNEQKKKTEHEPYPNKFVPPQIFLDAMLRSRGYSTKRYKSLRSGYHNKPTAHQQASYDVYVLGLIRRHDVKTFDELISSGLSPNPSNAYGESFVHAVCRHGDADLLNVLVKNGCDLQIADDCGRTPLHDACWATQPAFDVVEVILKKDVRLFHMIDSRGHCPLNYVRKEHFVPWNEFLESKRDEFWPKRNVEQEGEQEPPPLTLLPPDSRPLPTPEKALSIDMAKLVASGRLNPSEAKFLNTYEETTERLSDEDLSDISSDSYDSEDDESGCSSDDEEEDLEELFDFITHLPRAKTLAAGSWQ